MTDYALKKSRNQHCAVRTLFATRLQRNPLKIGGVIGNMLVWHVQKPRKNVRFSMAQQIRLSRSAFHEQFSLPDWRVLRHSLVASFHCPSFLAAARFVGAVAEAAEAAKHHPDIDLRYPGKVCITLTTHASNGLTSQDAELAVTISAIALEYGAAVSLEGVSLLEIAIDATNIADVIPFWRAILGYKDEPPANPGDPIDSLTDPLRIGVSLWFQQMDEPRTQRNRVHLDLSVPHDLAQERIERAVAAGGRLISDSAARAFWVLADPEGNEICVCTWQDRD